MTARNSENKMGVHYHTAFGVQHDEHATRYFSLLYVRSTSISKSRSCRGIFRLQNECTVGQNVWSKVGYKLLKTISIRDFVKCCPLDHHCSAFAPKALFLFMCSDCWPKTHKQPPQTTWKRRDFSLLFVNCFRRLCAALPTFLFSLQWYVVDPLVLLLLIW